jgi:pyruvate dehydrogenase E1 component
MPMTGEVTVTGSDAAAARGAQVDVDALDAVQRRVLWLATSIVHHANKVRDTASGVKVGGHQASSASLVSGVTGAVRRARVRAR